MKRVICIDPGQSGGIAYHDSDGTVQVISMPEGMTEIADTLRELDVVHGPFSCIHVEKTGTYMPGNSGPAAATFARHCGHIEAIAYMLGIPTFQVAPNVWMKSLGVIPKEKSERKKWIKEEMSRRYPYLKVTLKTADALGIMSWQAKGINERE
jgi:hypothetical protein